MNSFLAKLNPVAKLFIMLILMVPASFSYDLFFNPILILFILLCARFLGTIKIVSMLKKIRMFIVSSAFLVLFFLINRGYNNSGQYRVWIFGWDIYDITLSVSMGLRMILFALISLLFIMTTNTVTLVRSLIHQAKIPYKYCYAFLAAYRFVPTFGDELAKIRNAHKVRGVATGNGILINVINTPKYVTPLLITAIRKGDNVSTAMSARAFGFSEKRTYYNRTYWTKTDSFAILFIVVFIVSLLVILIQYNLFGFSAGF